MLDCRIEIVELIAKFCQEAFCIAWPIVLLGVYLLGGEEGVRVGAFEITGYGIFFS